MQIAILGRGVVGGGIVKLIEEAETPLLRKIKIKKSWSTEMNRSWMTSIRLTLWKS